jgi:hypothetical protein
VGGSFTSFLKVFSGGGGVIYAIDSVGKMFWYRHNDPKGGKPGFANGGLPKEIGSGLPAARWFAPPARGVVPSSAG